MLTHCKNFSVGLLIGFVFYIGCYSYIKQKKSERIPENYNPAQEMVPSRLVATETKTDIKYEERNVSKFSAKTNISVSNEKDHKPKIENPGASLRIVCYVLTYEGSHSTRVKAVRQTWGRRCDHLFFASTKDDGQLSAINFGGDPTHTYTYGRSKWAATYAYEHYKQNTDWFLKADDDTYVIMENLRVFLSSYNTSEPIFFGCRFKHFTEQGYFSGGGGYVMSREAMRRLVEEGLPNPAKSPQDDTAPEDVKIGKTLYNVGVKAMDVRDKQGRYRFFPFPISQMNPFYFGGLPNWFYDYIYYNYSVGEHCCSSTAITFHYMTDKMTLMEYFLYQVGVHDASNRREWDIG